jgi:hypothetical protein
MRILGSINYGITIKTKRKLNVSSRSGIIMARKLSDLQDVDISGVKDTFVLMYDETDKKFKTYDPDRVLSTSLSGGLPQDFINYLENILVPESLVTAVDEINQQIDEIIEAISQVYEYISSLTLGMLANVKESVDNTNDTFIIRYDKDTEKYEAVDPDEILSSAVDENGLPQNFITYMNEVLIPNSLLDALNNIGTVINELTLGDLLNVDDTGVLDKYVVMYNQALSTYVTVNPDEVLKASVEESTQPGLPEEFLDQLDTDLDNRIDYDGGEY